MEMKSSYLSSVSNFSFKSLIQATSTPVFKVEHELKNMKLSQILDYLSGSSSGPLFQPLKDNCGVVESTSIL